MSVFLSYLWKILNIFKDFKRPENAEKCVIQESFPAFWVVWTLLIW